VCKLIIKEKEIAVEALVEIKKNEMNKRTKIKNARNEFIELAYN